MTTEPRPLPFVRIHHFSAPTYADVLEATAAWIRSRPDVAVVSLYLAQSVDDELPYVYLFTEAS